MFLSCWEGQVIRRQGFDCKSHQGLEGGGVGGRTLDIQFKITCLKMIIYLHVCTYILISDLPYQTV